MQLVCENIVCSTRLKVVAFDSSVIFGGKQRALVRTYMIYVQCSAFSESLLSPWRHQRQCRRRPSHGIGSLGRKEKRGKKPPEWRARSSPISRAFHSAYVCTIRLESLPRFDTTIGVISFAKCFFSSISMLPACLRALYVPYNIVRVCIPHFSSTEIREVCML